MLLWISLVALSCDGATSNDVCVRCLLMSNLSVFVNVNDEKWCVALLLFCGIDFVVCDVKLTVCCQAVQLQGMDVWTVWWLDFYT